MKAWDITGRVICDRYGMKFVKANTVSAQNVLVVEPTHYIFALDDSGSMEGEKWQNLMFAFGTAIDKIKSIPNSEANIKISILVFNSRCRNVQTNVSPSKVNL